MRDYIPLTKRPKGYEDKKQDDFVPVEGFPKQKAGPNRDAPVNVGRLFHPPETRGA